MASFMGKDVWWAVPAAVLLGVPMYTNAAGIIPIVEALIGKGAALGTVLAFMMSVIALSLPEAVTVRVHDSTADMRYLVVPRRPPGTEGWSEPQLAALVTRDAMIGVAEARTPG